MLRSYITDNSIPYMSHDLVVYTLWWRGNAADTQAGNASHQMVTAATKESGYEPEATLAALGVHTFTFGTCGGRCLLTQPTLQDSANGFHMHVLRRLGTCNAQLSHHDSDSCGELLAGRMTKPPTMRRCLPRKGRLGPTTPCHLLW